MLPVLVPRLRGCVSYTAHGVTAAYAACNVQKSSCSLALSAMAQCAAFGSPTQPVCVCVCARPRARVCAEYFIQPADSNDCPAGWMRIETEAACRTAAAAMGVFFAIVETEPAWPRGCYRLDVAQMFFNIDLVGAGNSRAQLLCGAPHTCIAWATGDRPRRPPVLL